MLKNNFMFDNDKKNNLLTRIIDEIGIDKGTSQHNYSRWYNYYFEKIKEENLNILEIGVSTGKSLYSWKKYFANSSIYGIEKYKDVIDKNFTKDCNIFIGNQSSNSFLSKVCESVSGGFDIIIDDGSHITSDQVQTFLYLFKKMNSPGIYIIEDLQTSYNKKYRKGEYKSTINFLKKMIDKVNHDGKFRCNNFDRIIKKSVKLNKYEKIIESIHFYSGICFIFKR